MFNRILLISRRQLLGQRGLHTSPIRRSNARFSTNPSVDSMRRLASQLKMVIRYTTLTAASLTTATFLAWQSYHLYIEHYCEPTPDDLSYMARNLLHGAYVREKVAPDFEIAALYVRKVLSIALDQQHLAEDSDTVIRLRLRLAENETRAGNLLEGIAEYTRAWKLLLSKLNDNNEAVAAETAKRIGDLYVRIGDYTQAEEFLVWAVSKRKDRLPRVKTLCSLGSLYAVQRNFKLAMPLFLQALQLLSEEEEGEGICLKAIIQNQIAETMYGMGKLDEAMGWAQASLELCTKDGASNKDCRECGGVAANNLGKMLEQRKQFEEAFNYYKQALAYANTTGDLASQSQYAENLENVQKLLHNGNKLAILEDTPSPKDSTSTSSSSSWFGKLWK